MTVNTATPDYIVDSTLTDGEAWVPLATTVVSGTSTATVTFTSTTGANDWSQYMDLILIIYVASLRATADSQLKCFLSGDTTTTNYAYQSFVGDGSSASAAGATGVSTGIDTRHIPAASSTNVFGAIKMNFFDVNSGKFKSVITNTASDRDGAGQVSTTGNLWLSQAPITSIVFSDLNGANITADSRFDLFGVLPRMVTA